MSGHIELVAVDLLDGVDAWFTGRAVPDHDDPAVGEAGNLAHRRPHVPDRLARDRAQVCARMRLDLDQLHWMRQVHGSAVGVVDEATPPGAQLRDVDALVTAEIGRALVVQVADCVPLLLASTRGPIAVAHMGRRGLTSGVVEAALAALGAPAETVHASIGPAIGPCCYEVSEDLRDEVVRDHPVAHATTSWSTPSLDLRAAAASILEAAQVARVQRDETCTRCDPRWFSHRADRSAGRQIGLVVRRRATAREKQAA